MFLRFYLLLRFLRVHLYSGGSRILGLWHNFQHSFQFVIRDIMNSHVRPFPFLHFLSLPFLSLLQLCMLSSFV